jgi:hypothetical protein
VTRHSGWLACAAGLAVLVTVEPARRESLAADLQNGDAVGSDVLESADERARGESLTLDLKNGDTVSGEVLERTDEIIVLEHPVFGRLEIPIEQIEPRSLHVGLFGTSVLAGWEKSLDVGVSGSEGASDDTDILVGAALDYADDHKRWHFVGKYDVSYSDGDLDDHNANVQMLRDWLYPGSRWFAYSYSIYDFDEFEAWKHRVTTGGGPGYRIIPKGPLELDARSGPFLTYEFGDEDDARPEMAIGLFGRWKINPLSTLRLSSIYYQTLDQDERRNVSALEWKVRFSATSGMSLKLGVSNEYDSASQESENDLNYYSALSFDL